MSETTIPDATLAHIEARLKARDPIGLVVTSAVVLALIAEVREGRKR